MNVNAFSSRATPARADPLDGLNELERNMLAGLSGDDLTRALAVLTLQKQQELVAFITNILKSDTTLQVIGNLR
jgi:hypothetical protein